MVDVAAAVLVQVVQEVRVQVQADVNFVMSTRHVILSSFIGFEYFPFVWNVIPEKEKVISNSLWDLRVFFYLECNHKKRNVSEKISFLPQMVTNSWSS